MTLFIIGAVTLIVLSVVADHLADGISDIRSLYRETINRIHNAFIPWRALLLVRKVGSFFGLVTLTRTSNHGGEVQTQTASIDAMTGETDMTTKLETIIAASLNSANLDALIGQALANVVSSKVASAVADLTSEQGETSKVETTPIVNVATPEQPKAQETSAPKAQAKPATPKASAPKAKVNLDNDGHVISVDVPKIGTVAWNGRCKAQPCDRSGEVTTVTSKAGKTYYGVILGATVKPNSDALIVRPLTDKLTATRCAVPCDPSNLKSLGQVKDAPKASAPKASESTESPKAKPATVFATTDSYPVNGAQAVNVKDSDHEQRIRKGDLIVVRYSNGTLATTKGGEVKRFNPSGMNGYSVAIRKHKVVTPDSTVYFASDIQA